MDRGAGPGLTGPILRSLPLIAATVLLTVTTVGAGPDLTADQAVDGGARARYLMGTRLTIEWRGEVGPQVIDEAFQQVARLEEILSNWIESSELSRLNRDGFRAPFIASDELMHAVTVSLMWAARTDGAFDPTVESLVRQYGIRGDRPPAPVGAARHGDDDGEFENEAAEHPSAIGWRQVVIDSGNRSIRLAREGLGIDLGGIGKGIALDRAAEILTARGVAGGLLDFGGQVLAVGQAAPEGGWLIGVADPEQRDRVVAKVFMRAGSLATSGNSERAVIGGQGLVGHIFDPRSAAPAPFTGSVSVLADDGTTADALSTALFVMGRERGLQWAETRGIAALYIRRTADGGLEFTSTGAMRSGIEWTPVERMDEPGT